MARVKIQNVDSDRRIPDFDWRTDLRRLTWAEYGELPEGTALCNFDGYIFRKGDKGSIKHIQCAHLWDVALCGNPNVGILLDEINEDEQSVWE